MSWLPRLKEQKDNALLMKFHKSKLSYNEVYTFVVCAITLAAAKMAQTATMACCLGKQ